jgi:hypothetical protein
VFAFTDGVPEALNTEQEEFGEERLTVEKWASPDFPFYLLAQPSLRSPSEED